MIALVLAMVASVGLASLVVALAHRFRRGPTLGGLTRPHLSPESDGQQSVSFHAFFPESAAPGSTTLIRVVGATEGGMKEAFDRAREVLEAFGHTAVDRRASDTAHYLKGSSILSARLEVDAQAGTLLSEPVQYQLLPNKIGDDFAVSFDFMVTLLEGRRAVRADVSLFVGPILVAAIPLVIVVSDSASGGQINSSGGTEMDRVFVSYARSDLPVASSVGAACRALGVEFLIDNEILRAGDQWSEELLHQIDKADVFQLLWSEGSAASSEVEREWRHALGQRDSGHKSARFIRPVYWSEPPPPFPDELASTNFAYVPHLAPTQVGG